MSNIEQLNDQAADLKAVRKNLTKILAMENLLQYAALGDVASATEALAVLCQVEQAALDPESSKVINGGTF
jgi:hypothetical protein